MRTYKLPWMGLTLCCVSFSSFGLETGVSVGLSTEWTDNVTLANSPRTSDWLQVLDVDANLKGDESSYQYATDYRISYESYADNSFDATTYYNGTAYLNLALLPHRLDWNFGVESETTLQNTTDSNIPDNRDQRNMYSTSPTLTLISLSRDLVQVFAQATKVDFRESDQSNSDRIGANLNWEHKLSELTTLTSGVSQQKVNFDQAEDYESVAYQLGFKRKINGGSIDVAAGQTKLTPDVGEEIDGSHYAVDANWSNELHSIIFQAYQDLTDSSIGLSGYFDSSDFVTPSEIDTEEVTLVTRTRYSLGYVFSPGKITSVDTTVYWDDEQAEDNSSDTVRKGVSASVSYELRPGLTSRFGYNYEHTDTVELVADQTDIVNRYLFSLDKELGERLLVGTWIRYENARSSVETSTYEQSAIGARVEFSL